MASTINTFFEAVVAIIQAVILSTCALISVFAASIIAVIGLINAVISLINGVTGGPIELMTYPLWTFFVVFAGIVSPLGIILGMTKNITEFVSNLLYYIPIGVLLVITSPIFGLNAVPYAIGVAITITTMIITIAIGYNESKMQQQQSNYILDSELRYQ